MNLCSGFGAYHSPHNEKDPQPFITVTLPEIERLTKYPQQVAKDKAQWAIFSTLPSRIHSDQRENGRFNALWADVDSQPDRLTFAAVVSRVQASIPEADFIGYTSRSATEDNQKCRLIFPLAEPVDGATFLILQKILNDKLTGAGIIPDRATERAGQVCYLPNRGEYYHYHLERYSGALDPSLWADAIQREQQRIKNEQKAVQERMEQARLKAQHRMKTGCKSPIDAFNQEYPIDLLFDRYGYTRRNNRWLSPNSESGNPGVTLSPDGQKWLSTHSSDASIGRPTSTGTMGDAFDLFCFYEHSNDRGAAMTAAGNMFVVDGVTLNEHNSTTKRLWKNEQALAHEPEATRQKETTKSSDDLLTVLAVPKVNVSEPIPLPEDLLPVESFDYELLPRAVRPWVKDICERLQCPPDFVAVAVMAALGSLIGRIIGIRPQNKTDWTVTANMWALVVGRPGVMKSPAIEQARAAIKWLEAQALEFYKQALELYESTKVATDLRKEAAKGKVREALKKNPNADISDMLHVDEPEEPILRRYTANDTSAASLGELLRQTPNGLLVYRDELVSLLKSLDREDQAEGRGFYLTGWNGDSSYTIDRIGRGLNLHIPAVCISLLGGTQPGKISEYVYQATQGGSSDDGLLQRFGLLVWPDVDREWQNVDRWPDKEAKNQAFAVFKLLANLDPADVCAEQDLDFNGDSDGIPYLRLSPEALELFVEWRTELEHRLRSDDLHPALESHFSKYRKLIPGLALIIHLSDGGTGPVSRDATLQALAWSDYLESHARRVYGSVINRDVSTAKEILKRITKGDLITPFSSRDVWRPGWSKLSDRKAVLQALDMLVDYQWLHEEVKETGGRPATIYHLNQRAAA